MELVCGYDQETQSELERFEKAVEHWNEQERRLQKLDRYVRHTFSLCRQYSEELMTR